MRSTGGLGAVGPEAKLFSSPPVTANVRSTCKSNQRGQFVDGFQIRHVGSGIARLRLAGFTYLHYSVCWISSRFRHWHGLDPSSALHLKLHPRRFRRALPFTPDCHLETRTRGPVHGRMFPLLLRESRLTEAQLGPVHSFRLDYCLWMAFFEAYKVANIGRTAGPQQLTMH